MFMIFFWSIDGVSEPRLIKRTIVDNKEYDQCYADGMAQWRAGDFDGAIDMFRRCIALDPKNAAGYDGIGIAFGSKGDYDSMIVYCARAVALNPDDWQYHTNLAIAYHTRRLWPLAYHHAIVALDANPKQVRCLRVAGDVAYRLGDKRSAEVFFERSLEIDPNHAGSLGYIAGIQFRRGQIKAAFAKIKRVIKEWKTLS